jgi:uncharacterized protein (TIGR00369 family)
MSENNGFRVRIPFLEFLGVQARHIGPGEADVELELGPHHCNSYGIAHGGVIMTLLDVTMAVAGRAADPLDRGLVTIEMKSSFMQPGRGTLRTTARCVHRSTMAFCEAEITDLDGEIVARGSGTFKFVKGMPVRRRGKAIPGGDG